MGLRDRTLLTEHRCFFITNNCEQHQFYLIDEACFAILYDNLRFYNQRYNAQVIGYVFMSSHFHLILYFNEETRLSEYMRDFKKMTSKRLRNHLLENHTELALDLVRETTRQKFKIWESGFDDVALYTRAVCETKLTYMHQNPVKAGLIDYAEQYRHSSAAFYLSPIQHSSLLHYLDVF